MLDKSDRRTIDLETLFIAKVGTSPDGYKYIVIAADHKAAKGKVVDTLGFEPSVVTIEPLMWFIADLDVAPI